MTGSQSAPTVYEFGPFRLEPGERRLLKNGTPVPLTPKVFDTLCVLVGRAGRVVSKDDLMKAVWPDAVVEEANLTVAISTLRRALRTDGDAESRIETVPKVGYRFVAPVRTVPLETGERIPTEVAPSAGGPSLSRGWHRTLPIVAALLVGVTVIAALASRWRHSSPPPERDTVIVGDVVNLTGDPIFNETMRQALLIQLDQSPFLRILPDSRVRDTLRLMSRKPTDVLTPELALEVCRRETAKAVLDGAIAPLGNSYVLRLNAVDCVSGDTFAREQMQADRKEQVLQTLQQIASRLRGRLGESLTSIQRFDMPMERATTSSLDALRNFSLGTIARARGADVEAIGFFRRALELDPDFAMVQTRLSSIYSTAGEFEMAAKYAAAAYEHKDRVGERERFAIVYGYYKRVTGELDKAIDTLHAWKTAYPRDFDPSLNLASNYAQTGDFQNALDEARQAREQTAGHAQVNASLARAYLGLNEFAEARRVSEGGPGGSLSAAQRSFLYWLAFIDNDSRAMKRIVDSSTGTPAEPYIRVWQAMAEQATGHFRQAREEFGATGDAARRVGVGELAATAAAFEALGEAAAGNVDEARRAAHASLITAFGRQSSALAAIALALSNADVDAEQIDGRLARTFPADSLLNTIWLPCERAAIALNHDQPSMAIDLLKPAAQYEFGWTSYYLPAYIRGLSYLRMRDGPNAEREFKKILDHRGILPVSPLYRLAQLQFGRAASLEGDSPKARPPLEAFIAAWRDADSDVPELQQARRDYERLR